MIFCLEEICNIARFIWIYGRIARKVVDSIRSLTYIYSATRGIAIEDRTQEQRRIVQENDLTMSQYRSTDDSSAYPQGSESDGQVGRGQNRST